MASRDAISPHNISQVSTWTSRTSAQWKKWGQNIKGLNIWTPRYAKVLEECFFFFKFHCFVKKKNGTPCHWYSTPSCLIKDHATLVFCPSPSHKNTLCFMATHHSSVSTLLPDTSYSGATGATCIYNRVSHLAAVGATLRGKNPNISHCAALNTASVSHSWLFLLLWLE